VGDVAVCLGTACVLCDVRSAQHGGVFGLSIIKHVTLQKIVAHDFQYDPCMYI
jgi:hydroxymethylpyrimidine/phosphomethylpyrimidine kinase